MHLSNLVTSRWVSLLERGTRVTEESNKGEMRDPTDHVIHCYGRQEKVEAVVKYLLQQNPKMRIETTQNINAHTVKRATDKRHRQQAQEVLKNSNNKT